MAINELLSISNTAYTTGNDVGSSTFTKTAYGYYEMHVCASASTTVLMRMDGTNLSLNNGDSLSVDTPRTFKFNVPLQKAFTIRFGTNNTIRYLTLEFIDG